LEATQRRLRTERIPRHPMDALPFCSATLHAMRCPIGPHFTEKKGYPADPKTIGEMIRKRRLDLGFRQTDAAKMIGCDEMSVVNWENGHHLPQVNHTAGVLDFLGFNPFENGDTMAHRLVNHRKAHDMTQEDSCVKSGSIRARSEDGNALSESRRGHLQQKSKT
jgi:hypothetical protein